MVDQDQGLGELLALFKILSPLVQLILAGLFLGFAGGQILPLMFWQAGL